MEHFNFAILRCPSQSLIKAFDREDAVSPIIQEGLYLSSTDFWAEYQKIETCSAKDDQKLRLSLSKYWLRSCTRCTPYGTFAGSAIVSFNDRSTSLILNESSQHTRRIRVDMNYITEIIQSLCQLPEIHKQLKFFPNNSLYKLPNLYRYAEYFVKNNNRTYQLNSIPSSGYIDSIFEWAANGITHADLVNKLVQKEHVSVHEADRFIQDMEQSQLLQSALEPCVTGAEPLNALIDLLSGLTDIEQLTAGLREVQNLLEHPVEGVSHYQAIEAALKNTGINSSIPKDTLQTDLFLSLKNHTLDNNLVKQILSQAEQLLLLGRKFKNNELEDFKTRFNARYEAEEISLAIALDADLGIGYAGVRDESSAGGTLIDDFAVQNHNFEEKQDVSSATKFVIAKYRDYLAKGLTTIDLTDEELKGFEKETKGLKFPESLHLKGSLHNVNGELSEQNFVFFVSSFGGPSGGSLLGRFTHGDQKLCALTRELLVAEEAAHPEAIFAEIAHLPQARIGNILLRPLLRKYEIPYVGKSGADLDNQIPVSDLMLSLKNGELILRSKRLNKRIIPRLTTAHNFSYQPLPIYKFLCDLQMQEYAYPCVWDWGALDFLTHLPRVTYKNLIIKKERWKLYEKDIADIGKDNAEHKDYFESFRAKHKLPSRVVYVQADNELLIDFNEAAGIELFLHYLKRFKVILLEEFLFTEENCIVTDEEGKPYTNELIIPLHRTNDTQSAPPEKLNGQKLEVRRKFLPNSEWHYFKVYCGSKTAETILSETILPFIEKGLNDGLFEQFFFIRYRDDFGHFRIRFYNSDVAKQSELQVAFITCLQPLVEDGLVDKILLDTYSRELERYGAELIADAESLFFNDSLAVLRFLNLLDGTDADKYRLLFAMRGIDQFLGDFDLNISQKQALLKGMQAGYYQEFGASPYLQKQLNEKYRKYQKDIFAHMDPDNDIANEIDEAVAVFDIRSEMNAPIISNILYKIEGNRMERLTEVLPSFVHMFMNRLYIAQQRKYELVVYHFLEKYYSSLLARQKSAVIVQSF